MKIIKWILNKFGKVLAWIFGGIGAIFAIFGGVKMGKAAKLNRRTRKMRDEALKLHEEHYNKVQAVLESTTIIKTTAIDSFNDFAEQMERLQDRPEFGAISCKGVNLPAFTVDELKVVSNKVGLAVEGVAYAGAGAGLGIAAFGLSALAIGPGVLFGGIGMLVVGSRINKKAVENNKQVEQLVKDVEKIVKKYDELADAATMLDSHISSIYEQYENHLAKMKKILAKTTVWCKLTRKEQLVIENTILLVGMLYKLCKIELIVKVDEVETVNVAEVQSVESEVQAALHHTKPRGLFAPIW